ncbi:Rad17 cell cycle checkpoint protein-domain-containing protein [Phlyctochytrium arcticum]|nr:Rad17 cell cycle checkpoint protein-domain-containing protein [Phlyctochytrium arcticum]
MSTNKKSKPATRATPLTRKKPKTKAALNQGTSQALPLSDREPSTKRRKLAEDPSAERFYSSQHILNQWTIPVSQQSYRSSQPICENLESGSESELWIDKHAPLSEHELAVHTRKVKEVRAWLTQALSNSERSHARSLVGSIAALTGPSGAGKTAVIRALAKEMGFEIMEWSNPYNVNVLSEMSDSGNRRNATDEFQPRAGMVSITVQFQDFLASASKAPSLTFTNMPDAIDDYIPLPSSSPSSDRKVILVEDLPNVSNATTRTGVHTAIRNYIRSPRTKYPIVFIISDSTISTFDDEFLSGRSDASIDVNLVIPPDVRSSRAFTEIKFNPVAPTYLLKLLTRISNLEFRSPRQYKYRYDKESLDAIGRASGGDIRCALNSLQFHCLQPVENAPTRRKGKTGRPISEALITNVGARKVNLTIFHSIGRVLQTKRKAPLRTGQIIESLPEHLRPSYRHPVVHDPEEIFETSNLGAASYQTFLHENCALYYTDIDEMVTASSYLSSADLLLGRWQYQSSLASYAASITTRGLQFAHVHPVPAQPFGSRHLYKPAMFSALRKCRDTSSMISNIESEWLQAAILKKDRHVMQTEVRYSPPVLATDLLPYLGIIQDCSARIRQQRYMPVQVPPWQKQRPSLSRIPNKSEIHPPLQEISGTNVRFFYGTSPKIRSNTWRIGERCG